MLITSEKIGVISVLKVVTSCLTSADFATLRSAQLAAEEDGRFAHLVDLSGVRRTNVSGLAALLEFQSAANANGAIAFYGARPKITKAIAKMDLAALLSLYETQEAALDAPEFRAQRLRGVKSVLLVAGAGSRMAPMSNETPKPLLDLLGQPVISHLLTHLERFGLRDFLLNPGHLGPQFHAQFQTTAKRSFQFLNEGQYCEGRWQAAPLGSAGTLLALQERCAAFDADFFVFCGDAVSNINLAEMMAQHRASGAAMTIAAKTVAQEEVQKYGIIEADAQRRVRRFVEKPAPGATASRLASTGIYVINPRALARLKVLRQQSGMLDIAQHLVPEILRGGGRVDVYDADFDWVDIGCGKDYFVAISKGLRGLVPNVSPKGQEIRRNVWVAAGAELSARAVVVGPCYIGPGARIMAGAKLEGPCVIGAGAVVAPRALVQRSIIMPNTIVQERCWVSDMVAAGTWAFDHRFADGGKVCCEAMEGVTPIGEAEVAQELPLAGGL